MLWFVSLFGSGGGRGGNASRGTRPRQGRRSIDKKTGDEHMQIAQEGTAPNTAQSVSINETIVPPQGIYADYKIIRRNGSVVGFEPSKIAVAVTKAFLAVNGSQGAASARVRELVAGLTESVVGALMRRQPAGGTFHIEDIQD